MGEIKLAAQDKKLLRRIAIKVVKTMYLEIESWTPSASQVENEIKIVQKDIIKILEKYE